MTPTSIPTGETERVPVLDVLRGIALVGMFFVHFGYYASGGGAADKVYQKVVVALFEERFWAMFAMLFGVGFAIQLRRADARGDSFIPNYLRRILALAGFGFIAHGVFGFNVLLGYATWGIPLLFVRRWSVRALVITAVISAASMNIYSMARVAYSLRSHTEQEVKAKRDSSFAAYRAFRKANDEAQEATSYRAVFAARLEHMKWLYAQPFSFLPVNTLTLFLLGLIGLRLGIFDAPEQHRRLIASLMVFGAASWATAMLVFPALPPRTEGPMLQAMLLNSVKYGFGQVREMWLAFTYIGAVLLLVARNPRWLTRLGMFAWTGRMALTNYMIQVAILDLTFSKYALGLTITPLAGLSMAIALFVAMGLASRWWLGQFRYGPLEWLWRSITYARWQPIRATPPGVPVGEKLAAIG